MFYSLIASVWNTEIQSGRYLISKWDTVKNLDEKFEFWISHWRYNLWLKWFAPEVKNLQIGEYNTEDPIKLEDFFTNTLTKPIHTDQTITILPGWNIYDIDDYLARKQILKWGEFVSTVASDFSLYQKNFSFLVWKESLEGFLYPDTYRIRTDATAHDIVTLLLREFEKKILPTYENLGDSWYRELILASIVEREERKKSEQPIVAWILSKRVSEWIPMWADATVCTGYAKTQKQCTPAFIASVIYDKNPFNTRNKQWYPPTPISNVPLSTWENTLNKTSSPYYYYLHWSDGVIHYARTLEEHGENKRKYLQ